MFLSTNCGRWIADNRNWLIEYIYILLNKLKLNERKNRNNLLLILNNRKLLTIQKKNTNLFHIYIYLWRSSRLSDTFTTNNQGLALIFVQSSKKSLRKLYGWLRTIRTGILHVYIHLVGGTSTIIKAQPWFLFFVWPLPISIFRNKLLSIQFLKFTPMLWKLKRSPIQKQI